MTHYLKRLERVENDWCHNWCFPYAKLYDYVKGPLRSPMLTVPVPYTINRKDMGECDCGKRLKEYYSKSGIPDPWDEYLIIRREGEERKDLLNKFPKIDLDITKSLARNYRVYLGQGIPDPWKNWTVLETAEPQQNKNFQKNFKSCADNFKIGPEHVICDAEKVCCPHCNRNLIVLCFRGAKKKDRDKNKEVESVVEEILPVAESELVTERILEGVPEQLPVQESEPIEGNIRVRSVIRKDASVETNWIPEERKTKVVTKICKCKTDRICSCCESGSKCLFCPVCNMKKSGTVSRKCKNYMCCTCTRKAKEKKDNIKRKYYFNIGSMYPFGLPLKCEFFGQNGPWTAQRLPYFGCPPETNYIPQGSMNPFPQNNWTWLPQQFVDFHEKNHHGLQLQLICPKCENKRKNWRKGRRNDDDFIHKEFLPCHCENLRKMKRRKWEGFACFCPHKEAIEKEENHEIGEDKTSFSKPNLRKPEDIDYLNMLETFGLKDHFQKLYEMAERANSDHVRPSLSTFPKSDLSSLKTSLEKPYQEATSDFDKSPSQRHKFSHNEPKQMKKNTFGNTSKDINANSKKSAFPRTNHKQFSIAELWKVKVNPRRPKHKALHKKELYKRKTNFGKNFMSDDSDTSLGARTRRS